MRHEKGRARGDDPGARRGTARGRRPARLTPAAYADRRTNELGRGAVRHHPRRDCPSARVRPRRRRAGRDGHGAEEAGRSLKTIVLANAKGGISHGTRRSDGIPPGGHNKNNKGFSKDNNITGINRLTPGEIQSFTATVAALLGEGQSIEEVEARFAPTMHAVDWATVRTAALAQAAPKRGK